MTNIRHLQKALVKTGVGAGIAVSIMYPARTFIPLPDFVSTSFFVYFGPLLVVAFIGLYPFLAKPRTTVAAILGTAFGVIGGVANTMFAVVQMTNLHYIYGYIRSAETAPAKQEWRDILNGVFTVQNGLNYVSDLFIDWTAFMFAIVLWSHPKFSRIFSITGVIAAGFHFVMKAYSFPVPPGEAGLFDAGPLVSIWFAVVTIQVLRNVRWMDEPSA